MAANYKVLGQSNPVGLTTTTLYTVPTYSQTVVSTITICNTGNTSATYRVSVCPGGVGVTTSNYLVYDNALNATDSTFLTIGMTLATTDVVRVYASSSNLGFSLFGSEIN